MAEPTDKSILNDGYMPRPPLSLPEYQSRIGQEIGRSDWVLVDQKLIDAFAALTGDNQFIHVDPVRARDTPFGTTVAHGFLILSIIGGLGPKVLPPVADARIALNYGFNHIRIVSPVPSGSRIRALFTVNGAEQRAPGQIATRIGVVVEIEDQNKPAIVAEWVIVTLVGPA